MDRVGERSSLAITYRPELDGVRAVAIAFVLANHLLGGWIGWERAGSLGFVGVAIFFALSGYLITGLLLTERRRTGTIGLRSFYLRRVARLAPALLAMVGFVVVTGILGAQDPGWQTGLVGALTYSSNWIKATGAELGALTHTWTLAVEEQFYLLWPLVLFARPQWAGRVAVGTIAAGVIVFALLPWSVAGFTTPVNAIALMIGALFAMQGVGSSWLRALSPLAPFGKRAYSLYLWNWPMTLAVGPVGGLIATFALAELSYRLVERPIVARVRQARALVTPPSPTS